MPPIPKVEKKHEQVSERMKGRKKKKNNKGAPSAKSRPKSMNIHDLHLEHNSYKHNL
jgi:hypothetical protein